MQIVYARGTEATNFQSDKPLYVNNCGYYKDLNSDITVNRPQGRDDYHLLMTSSGCIQVGERRLTAGQAYLFYPSKPQHYRYAKWEGSEYYWLHFSGQSVQTLLESYGLREGVVDVGSSRGEVERLIRMMLRALIEKYKYADGFCEGLLSALLSLVSAPPVISSPYYRAIKLLSDPENDQSVEEIASTYHMSSNHFIRSFRQYVGQSPNDFRIAKRMELACEMLTSTDLPVERVASAVGYSDALYFSRAFKKRIGVSPTEYRRGEVFHKE